MGNLGYFLRVVIEKMMETPTSVPFVKNPKRSVEELPATFKDKVSNEKVHPVQKLYAQTLHREQAARKKMIAGLYGLHTAFSQEMDEMILRRAIPIAQKPRQVGLDAYLSRDTTIDFRDVLDDPLYREIELQDVHAHFVTEIAKE